MNTKILVCCHKNDLMESSGPYFPIHVGKTISNVDIGIQGDDTGDNISAKNGSYCELTGMYWAWKNLKDVDVIGLCHYRRYFDFHNQCRPLFPYTSFDTSIFASIDKSIPEQVLKKVSEKGTVVVSRKTNCNSSLMLDYCYCHISDDFKTLYEIIQETQDAQCRKAFFKVMCRNNRKSTYNMFIMKWKDFDDYCNWLFPILAELEKRTDISNYSALQGRIYGYVSERLLNVWLEMKNKKQIQVPVMWFNDGDDCTKRQNPVIYLCRCILNNLSNVLSRPRSISVVK